jgi:hypothetical protein
MRAFRRWREENYPHPFSDILVAAWLWRYGPRHFREGGGRWPPSGEAVGEFRIMTTLG